MQLARSVCELFSISLGNDKTWTAKEFRDNRYESEVSLA